MLPMDHFSQKDLQRTKLHGSTWTLRSGLFSTLPRSLRMQQCHCESDHFLSSWWLQWWECQSVLMHTLHIVVFGMPGFPKRLHYHLGIFLWAEQPWQTTAIRQKFFEENLWWSHKERGQPWMSTYQLHQGTGYVAYVLHEPSVPYPMWCEFHIDVLP